MQENEHVQPEQNTEVVTQEQTDIVSPEEPVTEQPVEQVSQSAPVRETNKEYNMRMMRERMEESDRKLQEYEEKVRMLSQQQQYQQPTQASEPREQFSVADDDIIDGRSWRKYDAEVKDEIRQLKEQIKRQNNDSLSSQAELRLKSEFPDYFNVVNKENINMLAKIYPDEYQSMLSNGDIYSRGKTAYNMISRFGLIDDTKEVTEKIDKNKNKPRATGSANSAPSSSPMANLGSYERRVLSPERIAQLRREMNEYR